MRTGVNTLFLVVNLVGVYQFKVLTYEFKDEKIFYLPFFRKRYQMMKQYFEVQYHLIELTVVRNDLVTSCLYYNFVRIFHFEY
jgi:hypothetical protein